MTIYLMSDTHFQHAVASKLRGFDTPEAHDVTIIKNAQKVVGKNDELFILGDVTFNANGAGFRENLKLLDQIPGTKHLIVGNHDRCAPNNSNGFRYKKDFLKHFDSVSEMVTLSCDGIKFLLSHYPYDTSDDRFQYAASNVDMYDAFKPKDAGMPLIHGHTHTKYILTLSKNYTPQVNVNMESIKMKPIALKEIAAIVKSIV